MWMPPDIDTIYRRIKADYRANMSGAEPIWPNNLYVNAKVFSGIADAYYRRLAWLRDQRFAHSADPATLQDMAAELALSAETATFAAGELLVTADIGTTFLAGTRFLRVDGEVFVTDEDVTTTQASQLIAVHAESPGSLGNTEADTVLTMEAPIAGFTSAVVSDESLTGGKENENPASLRAKILDFKRNPAVQGSLANYKRWAYEWPGVTRAWAWRADPSAGSVHVSFMMDDVYPNGIPTAGDVTGVAAILEAKAPGRTGLIVDAPVASPIAVTLTALSPNTTSVQKAVRDELKAMIKRRAKPGTFASPFVFSKSWLDEAISIAPDEDSHTMSVPAASITYQAAAPGDPPPIATLGTVTFPA